MKRTDGKLFLREFKGIATLPALVLGAYLLLFIIQFSISLIGGVSAARAVALDKESVVFSYLLFLALLGSVGYRSLADRKLYARARISTEKLFLIRVFWIFVCVFTYITVLLLCGTANLALFKGKAYLEYLRFDRVCIFVLQGKGATYLLFGVGVGMSAAVIYSAFTCIVNAVRANFKWYVKVICIALLGLAFTSVFAVPLYFAGAPTIGTGELFGVFLPTDGFFSSVYEDFVAFDERLGWFFYAEREWYEASYALCWNVCNVVTLACGFGLLALGFFSDEFFKLRQNEGYLRVKKGGV